MKGGFIMNVRIKKIEKFWRRISFDKAKIDIMHSFYIVPVKIVTAKSIYYFLGGLIFLDSKYLKFSKDNRNLKIDKWELKEGPIYDIIFNENKYSFWKKAKWYISSALIDEDREKLLRLAEEIGGLSKEEYFDKIRVFLKNTFPAES